MKTLVLLLAVVALGASQAQAYSHSIRNTLGHTVKVWVNYAACSNDTWIIKPGEVVTFRSGLCCISKIRMQTVDDDGKSNPGAVTTSPNAVGYCENTNTYLSRNTGNHHYIWIK